MNGRRRVVAAILCAVLLLSMFVSSAYVAHEAAHPHECAGEDCPICQCIAQVARLRRGLGVALLALLLLCLAMAVRREVCPPETAEVPALRTLVGRKIRLNN